MKEIRRRIILRFTFVCCLLLGIIVKVAIPVQAATQENEERIRVGEDVYATLDTEGTLTISGTGDMWDNPIMQDEWNTNPDCPWFGKWERDITSVVIEDGVTSIGDYAFVVSTITNTVRNHYCHQYPHGLSNLKNVKIGSGVEKIGAFAFWKTASLSYINIPGNVKEIGEHAFYESSLESIKLQNGIEKIDEGAFRGSALKAVNIPGSVRMIERNAFIFSQVRDVTIQPGVGVISNSAFGMANAKILSKNVILETRAFDGPTVITCYKGSTADNYAAKKGMKTKYITESKKIAKSLNPSVKIRNGVMIITCKKVVGADGYQVRYSSNASMKNAVTISGATVSIANLKKKKTYYVQVRAYKKGAKKLYGEWSDIVTKTMK